MEEINLKDLFAYFLSKIAIIMGKDGMGKDMIYQVVLYIVNF